MHSLLPSLCSFKFMLFLRLIELKQLHLQQDSTNTTNTDHSRADNSGDTADISNPPDTADTTNSPDTADTSNSPDTADSSDTVDTSNSPGMSNKTSTTDAAEKANPTDTSDTTDHSDTCNHAADAADSTDPAESVERTLSEADQKGEGLDKAQEDQETPSVAENAAPTSKPSIVSFSSLLSPNRAPLSLFSSPSAASSPSKPHPKTPPSREGEGLAADELYLLETKSLAEEKEIGSDIPCGLANEDLSAMRENEAETKPFTGTALLAGAVTPRVHLRPT